MVQVTLLDGWRVFFEANETRTSSAAPLATCWNSLGSGLNISSVAILKEWKLIDVNWGNNSYILHISAIIKFYINEGVGQSSKYFSNWMWDGKIHRIPHSSWGTSLFLGKKKDRTHIHTRSISPVISSMTSLENHPCFPSCRWISWIWAFPINKGPGFHRASFPKRSSKASKGSAFGDANVLSTRIIHGKKKNNIWDMSLVNYGAKVW